MQKIKTYQGTVYPWHCDHMGHMNVQFYVAKFDEASWNLFTLIGLTPRYLNATEKGLVAVEQCVRYYKEAVAGDTVYIESEIMEIREKVLRIKHALFFTSTNEMSAETEITGLHIDKAIRKGVALPKFAKENFQKLADVGCY